MTTRQALWGLIGGSTVLRLIWAVSVGGFTNEAYYYLYVQNLDWSYFDHPPMVAVVSAAGLALLGGIWPVLGLRLGFIALFAGSSWLLARLTSRFFGLKAGVLAALALNTTFFYGVKIGTLADPDGPLLFFWLLTLDRLATALDKPERISTWVTAGLAWGAALMSKYHAALIPVGVGLYLILWPSARRCLRTPGPYLAIILGLAFFSPVIVWNASHGWASFAYQGSRAGGFQGFRPEPFCEAVVGQALCLTPWIWWALVGILFSLFRRGVRNWSGPETFLVSQAVPAVGLFLAVSTFRRIMPHWPLIGFVPVMAMLGRLWSERLTISASAMRLKLVALSVAPVVLASFFIVQARTGLFQDRQGRLLGVFAPALDPTVDTIRWDQIARELRKRGLLGDPNTFLFTDSWRFSAELAMATRGEASVACFHRDSRSFTFWSRPEDWVGRDAIFVRVDDGSVDADVYTPWFTRIELLGKFPIVRGGISLLGVRLYRCVRLTDPFPFGYSGSGPIPRPQKPRALVGEPPRFERPASQSLL